MARSPAAACFLRSHGRAPLRVAGCRKALAAIAGVVIVLVVVLGLAPGQDFQSLFVSAVSLAVPAIPEGLPAVMAFTLAMGASRLAKRGAHVKRSALVLAAAAA